MSRIAYQILVYKTIPVKTAGKSSRVRKKADQRFFAVTIAGEYGAKNKPIG